MISGRYSLDREIGRGATGAVWLGRDETLGRPVALKRIGLLPGTDSTDLARAEREARLSARLHHPNVVATPHMAGGAIFCHRRCFTTACADALAVLDGGEADVGVESTIIACLGDVPRLLRPGGVPREAISVSGYWKRQRTEDGWREDKAEWNRLVEADAAVA